MSKKTTLAVLLSVMLVTTVVIVWDAAALGAADLSEPDFAVCAYKSDPPCPTRGDCGYRWDGICCIPRCHRSQCLGICIAVTGLTPSLTP